MGPARAPVVILCLAAAASAAVPATSPWEEDLALLARELPGRHAAPETERPLAAFRAEVERLRPRLPALRREQILVEFARLAASFGDSHTKVPLQQPAAGFGAVPLGLYLFGADLRLVATDPAHADLLGTRLAAIEGRPIQEVLDRLRPILADDSGNQNEWTHSAPQMLAIPEVLAGLDLAPAGGPIRFTFEDDQGSRRTEAFGRLPPADAAALTARVLANDGPALFTHRRDRWYWSEPAAGSRLIYARVSRCAEQDGQESLAAFAKGLAAAIRKEAPARVALDLRLNTGGDARKVGPLGDVLVRAVRAGEARDLAVILGRHTYSAAILLAARLRHEAGARFAGETPRAAPNRQGEVESFLLPNSKLTVTYSSRFHRPFPELGEAAEIPLDVPAPWTW